MSLGKWFHQNRGGLFTGVGLFASVYGGIVYIYEYRQREKYKNIMDLIPPEDPAEAKRQKVFLVTGANSGLGKAMTKELAMLETSKIYMLCRNMERCEVAKRQLVNETKNKFLYCTPCDLASFTSIRECANKIKEKEKRIDGLLNNAGVMYAPKSYSEDGIEIHWAVNHLGHYLLTKLLKDQLMGGRVLYMIDMNYRNAKDGIKFHDLNSTNHYSRQYAFYQSQLANVLMLQKLAQDFKDDFISVNGVFPGTVTDTNIKRHMSVEKNTIKKFVLAPMLWIFEKTAADAAYTPMFLLQDRMAAGKTGKIFYHMSEMSFLEIGVNAEAAKKLIAVDDYWTGLKSKEEIVVGTDKTEEK